LPRQLRSLIDAHNSTGKRISTGKGIELRRHYLISTGKGKPTSAYATASSHLPLFKNEAF
jgi:hypothetical protein